MFRPPLSQTQMLRPYVVVAETTEPRVEKKGTAMCMSFAGLSHTEHFFRPASQARIQPPSNAETLFPLAVSLWLDRRPVRLCPVSRANPDQPAIFGWCRGCSDVVRKEEGLCDCSLLDHRTQKATQNRSAGNPLQEEADEIRTAVPSTSICIHTVHSDGR
jgi:hypothetical protein